MRLPEAYALARGNNVLVAVIDSGVDFRHPDIRDGIAASHDALNSPEGPHVHGTAIAGAVASRYQYMGAAPGARVLAIRSFSGTVGFTFAIIKGIEHAVAQQARIINMSFAGPSDPATLGLLAMAHDKGLVLIAAAGNFGPQSPPQYPGAAPNVIAVSATDSSDRLYVAANRGRHVAVSAPGVQVQLPAPNGLYQTVSGTSFATGYVSGVAALLLERKPGLVPDEVKRILETTARDLGPRGKDDQFGAGRVDAYQAVFAVEPETAVRPALTAK
jgi:subtilisin family serine protease